MKVDTLEIYESMRLRDQIRILYSFFEDVDYDLLDKHYRESQYHTEAHYRLMDTGNVVVFRFEDFMKLDFVMMLQGVKKKLVEYFTVEEMTSGLRVLVEMPERVDAAEIYYKLYILDIYDVDMYQFVQK